MFLLKVLGSLSLHSDTSPVPPEAQQKRRLGLLSLLAIAGERGIARDRLQAFLWPESSAPRSRHALDQLVYATRRALGVDPILAEGRDLRLLPSVIETDVGRFTQEIRAGRLDDAVAAYGGPLLDGFHLADSREVEAWIDGERARLQHEYHTALESLATAAAARGENASEISWWRRFSVSDAFSSRAAVGLIEALTRAGDRGSAIQHARNYQQLVRSELGVEPDPAIDALIATLNGSAVINSAIVPARKPAMAAATAELKPDREAELKKPQPALTTQPSRLRPRVLAAFSLIIAGLISSFAILERAQRESLGGNAPGRRAGAPSVRARPADSDALRLYLLGQSAWEDRSKPGLDTAVVYFRKALEVDPTYAEAYGGLANAYALLGYSGYRPADAMFPKAKAAALRAIELNGHLAAPHAALGMVLIGERNFSAAESALRKSIAIDSMYATAHQWYGILFMIIGRPDRAVAETGRAAVLDPLSLQIQNNYATFLSASGRPADALRHYQKVVGEEPDSAWTRRNPWLLTNMANVYQANGQYDRALRYAERAVEINPRHPRALLSLASVYDQMGRRADARAVFAKADTTNEHYPAYRALRYASEGNADSAFVWFDRVKEWGIPVLITLGSTGSVPLIRDDPRFGVLLQRLGMKAKTARP